MKTRIVLSTLSVMALSLAMAAAAPHQEGVTKAAKKLADAGSYTWKMTSEGGNFNPGPTEGKIGKDGTAVVTRSRRDNTYTTVYHGTKAAMETDEGWKSVADLENDTDNRRSRFWARMLQNFQPPAEQAMELIKDARELTDSGGMVTGKLTEEGVKKLMTFRRGGGDGPDIRDAAGSVKFWIKDGVLTKYQYHVQGSMSFNGNDVDVDRTTTVELSEIGSTKVEVPEGAKKKLS